ncbi:MAG: hypothetical protein M0T74_13055 [Desulfitobacterium hafniense]|nr:hypothetical protein [Desulfitobacterium hafniense]
MSDIMGLDIGGANIKVCRLEMDKGLVLRAEADSVYHEVWRDPAGIRDVLKNFEQKWDRKNETELKGIALTMTAELCDIFPTKADGVITILRLVEEVFPNVPIYVWTTRGIFVSASETKEKPLEAAAANWLASATSLARSPLVGNEPALLIDMGSTTTDILPLVRGEVAVKGRTDLERLLSGELVYTGVLRTQVNSIVGDVFVSGIRCRVAHEYFAISADVYRLLDSISEEDYDVPTPDGGGRDLTACSRRLARVVASEPEELGSDGVYAIARYVQEKQIQQIQEAIWQILSRREWPSPQLLITAGQGSFLLEQVAVRLGWKAVPWWEMFPAAQSEYAMTAYTVAWLLATQLG